jgi:hypothetical protein
MKFPENDYFCIDVLEETATLPKFGLPLQQSLADVVNC